MSVRAGEAGQPSAETGEQNRGRHTFPRLSSSTLLAILIMLAVLPYANTLFNGFVHDDNNEVLNNPFIRNFSHLKDIFTTNVLAHLGARAVTNYYRPISVFGFMLCYQAFGPLAYGFHLANILLNAAVVCLLFVLTEELFHNQKLAFLAAAIFALHPIHNEAVAWVSAVTDLDLGLFYLLTFWCFLKVARPGGRRADWALLSMAGSFVLCLLSKEQAVTLPLLATLYEHFYREDRGETSRGQKFARYYLLWLMTLGYFIFRLRFFGGVAAVLLMPRVTWLEAFFSAFALVGQYLGKMLWPVRLSAFYTFHKSTGFLDLRVWAGLMALALSAVLFVFLWKRARLASFGLLWFFATLAPVLNARWIGPNVFTERYLYLPSVGLCWVAAWWGLELWARAARKAPLVRKAFAGAVCILALLATARIAVRNRDWRNEISYYCTTLAAEPEAAGFHINLGAVYWNTGNAGAAEREWRTAQQLIPNNAIVLNNLGLVYAGRKDYEKAAESFRESMLARPNYTDAHLNLGRVYAEMGLVEPAELQLRSAVALAPLNVGARNQLGAFYLEHGRLSDAETQFVASAASTANSAAFDALGDIYSRVVRPAQAEQAYQAAVSLDNFDYRAHFGLAALYEAAGKGRDALREYEAGLQTDPRNVAALAAVQRLRGQASAAHESSH